MSYQRLWPVVQTTVRLYKTSKTTNTSNLTHRNQLHVHLSKHHSHTKVLKCMSCKKCFKQHSDLKTHFQRMHQLGYFQCSTPGCAQVFETREAAYYHRNKKCAIRFSQLAGHSSVAGRSSTAHSSQHSRLGPNRHGTSTSTGPTPPLNLSFQPDNASETAGQRKSARLLNETVNRPQPRIHQNVFPFS